MSKGSYRKWLTTSQYKKIADFMGRKVVILLALGTIVGLSLFVIEVAFAYGLQAFLLSLGVMTQEVVRLPRWVPNSSLKMVLGFMLALGTIRGFLYWVQLYMQGLVHEYVGELQRSRMIRWVFHSESVSSPEIMTLFGENTSRVCSMVLHFQNLIIQMTSCLFLGLSLLWMVPFITVAAAIVLGVVWMLMRWIDHRVADSAERAAKSWERCNTRMFLNIKNLLLMHIYGTENEEEKKTHASLDVLVKQTISIYYYTAVKYGIIQILGVVLVCSIALFSKFQKDLAPGILVTYFYLFMRLLTTFSAISLAVSYMHQNWPHVMKVADWWMQRSFDGRKNYKVFELQEKLLQPLPYPVGWQLKNVSFSYLEDKSPIIKNLDLIVEPAKALIITGPSGVGKTTLLNLMLGGLVPTRGVVEVTGGEVPQSLTLSRPRLLRSIGYVGPESYLIEGSIHENITYGLHREPTQSEITKALEMAECQFVFSLPEGLSYFLTEQGQGLSAGQKQRLSLARALLRDPRALILDEATSNLDMETEAKLLETLSRLRGQMTIIAVTHRESLLKIADQHLKLGQ